MREKRDRNFACVFCCDLHLILMSLVFYKRPVLRRVKFGGAQLFSRLSHKVYRLLSFPVLLRKFTITLQTTATAAKTSSLKLCRVYSNPLKVLSVGEFSCSWILGSSPKFRKRKTHSCLHVCIFFAYQS